MGRELSGEGQLAVHVEAVALMVSLHRAVYQHAHLVGVMVRVRVRVRVKGEGEGEGEGER